MILTSLVALAGCAHTTTARELHDRYLAEARSGVPSVAATVGGDCEDAAFWTAAHIEVHRDCAADLDCAVVQSPFWPEGHARAVRRS